MAVREVCKGRTEGILLFLIFGLSMYTTAMSVAFMMGFKSLIPVFQFFKEILVLSVLTLNILSLRYRPRFHLLDYAILAFLGYTFIYAILPIGEQGLLTACWLLKAHLFTS